MTDDASVAAKLSILYDTLITPCDGGFDVKRTDAHVISVLRMIVNWRVVRTPLAYPDAGPDREFCYFGCNGPDLTSLLRAVGGAVAWDGTDDTSPEGWDKTP